MAEVQLGKILKDKDTGKFPDFQELHLTQKTEKARRLLNNLNTKRIRQLSNGHLRCTVFAGV